MKSKNKIISLVLAGVIGASAFFMPVNNVQATQIYKGVDVYEYDNIQSYSQLKNDGVEILIQKASEGLYHNDALLQYRSSNAIAMGFKVGYYHFADNTGQPELEAQHFLNQINGLHSDTYLWLDIENESNWTKCQAIYYVNRFVAYVRSKNYRIGLYSGMSFYYEYLQGNIPSDLPLWLASYGQQPLQYPNGVSWQYSESGSLPGVIGNIDLDYFNDSIFTGQAPTVVNNAPVQVSEPYYNGYNINKVRGLQHLINGLGIAKLSEDGELGSKTLNAMSKLPTAQVKGYHNNAYTDWLENQLGQPSDHIFGNSMNNVVRNFQKSKGLSIDGKVGINTLKEILK